jgi:hypothetical protein
MTDRRAGKLEFDAVVGPEGTIAVPPALLSEMNGARVRVLLTEENVAQALTAAGVAEEEVQRIAARQMEPRERVLRFLLSEGSAPQYGKRTRRRGRG